MGASTFNTFFQNWTPLMDTDYQTDTYLPQEQALGTHMIDWKYLVHLDTPHYHWVERRW